MIDNDVASFRKLISWETVRHQVAIAGRVIDEITVQVKDDKKIARSIAGARVEIIKAPKEFRDWLSAKARQYGAGWKTMAERPDRTHTAADGSFYFLDLPDGDYKLTASLPGSGSRYCMKSLEKPAKVSRDSDNEGKINMSTVNLALPPTALCGQITIQNTKDPDPVAMADVQVKGSGEHAFTDDRGQYLLTGLEKGKRTVVVVAQSYEEQTQTVELTEGRTGELNVGLKPKTI